MPISFCLNGLRNKTFSTKIEYFVTIVAVLFVTGGYELLFCGERREKEIKNTNICDIFTSVSERE